MPYKCLDCGNATKTKFVQGRCPACDSFNVQRVGDGSEKVQAVKPKKTVFQIFLLILFWSLFAYGVWENYIKPNS